MHKYLVPILVVSAFFSFRAHASTVAYESHEQKQYLIWAMAKQYNVSFDALYWVAEKESKFNPKAFNPKDTDGKAAYGTFQYKLGTWRRLTKECGFDYDEEDVWSFEANVATTACAWSKGYAREWGPYKEAIRRFGSVVLSS